MKDTPTPPAAIDPVALASAQGTANLDTAIAQSWINATNQTTPYGSSKFDVIGTHNVGGKDVPQFGQTITLSPAEQAKLDKTNAVALSALDLGNNAVGRVANSVSQPFGIDGAPGMVSNVGVGDIKTSIPGQTYATSFAPSGDILKNLDLSGVSGIPGLDDFGAERARVEEALYSRLDPQFDRDRDKLETRLSNQGIGRNSEAWNRAIDEHNRALTDARMQTTLYGGQEQQRLFDQAMAARGQTFGEALSSGGFTNASQGQQFSQDLARADFGNASKAAQLQSDLSGASFANAAEAQRFNEASSDAALQNAARERWIQEQSFLRNQPINELSALLGFSNGVQMPNFSAMPTTGIAPTDVIGANQLAYKQQADQYAADLANQSSFMGGMFDLAGGIGSALIMSDRRMKNVVLKLPETLKGIALYLYRYIGGDDLYIGVMAQDVERVMPDAVVTIKGIKHVDYGRITA